MFGRLIRVRITYITPHNPNPISIDTEISSLNKFGLIRWIDAHLKEIYKKSKTFDIRMLSFSADDCDTHATFICTAAIDGMERMLAGTVVISRAF